MTGYFQNVRTYNDAEAKLKSNVYGGMAMQWTQKTFDLCNDFLRDGAYILMRN